MSTTIDSMTGINIRSPFFDTTASFNLFPTNQAPKKNRIALVYGANGSGKSTIAQGFREYAMSTTPKTVDLVPVVGTDIIKMSPGLKAEKFFIFDETYISQNIRVQESGLGTIVLFGKQVELERQLEELEKQIVQVQTDIDSKSEFIQQYKSATNVVAPEYWQSLIIKKLQATGGWAETSGIRIKKNHIKTRVTEIEVDRLGKLKPRMDEETTRAKLDELLVVFDSTDASALPISPQIRAIEPPEKIVEAAKILLAKAPQEPTLTSREQELLQSMGIDVLSTAKGFLSVRSHKICPTCLQPISEEHRVVSLQQIENILNREVEEYRNELKKFILPEIQADLYEDYSVLDSELLGKLILQISSVNSAIENHNKVVQAKISDPLSLAQYDTSTDLITVYKQLNDILAKLEDKRVSYNQIITNRQTTEKELLKLNDEIAHYTIDSEYQSLILQRTAKQTAEKGLIKALQAKNDLLDERQLLDSQRKNLQIAVEQINKSLSYIFYSDTRLQLYLGNDQMYHLKVNGKEVSPNKISCGERNALALSYFFAEIAKGTELQKLYYDEMFLVIDDPVSSFDVENRVGILSFLRYKLNQVLTSCATTKVLMMTHDVSVMFDLRNALNEISSNCAGIGKNSEYRSFQLLNKAITPFMANSHNEYTQLMRRVYEYGCNPDFAAELTIGNTTRRVLEAFATFTFKEGVEKVSLNPRVLALIPDQNKRAYFQNSMYRLVLNTESHTKENVQGAPEMSFFSHLTTVEKQRTARDVLCFMYCVNPAHILSHLPDAQKELDDWMTNVK